MSECVGILAGGGQFPRLVAQNARQAGLRVAVCGFYGHTDPALEADADAFVMLHLGQLNKMLAFFRKHGVRRLCMAGAISKPKALDFRPDWRAARVVFALRRKGDDALLRAVIGELEKDGFSVLPPTELAPTLDLTSTLICPAGVLTRRAPTPEAWADIRYAWPIAAAMGRFDIGQCLVARQGMVVAVECLEGTDATLLRGAQLGGEGCVAVKMAKPGQDERVDLPSVGLTTIRNLVGAKYAALAVQADKTLFFDREESVRLADRNGLAIVAITEGEI